MPRFLVTCKTETDYELTIDAETGEDAREIARIAIEENSRPKGLVDFWSSNPEGLELFEEVVFE